MRLSPDGQTATVTIEWFAPGIAPSIPVVPVLRRDESPEIFDYFLRNEVLFAPRRDELPPEMAGLRHLMEMMGAVAVRSRTDDVWHAPDRRDCLSLPQARAHVERAGRAPVAPAG